LTFARPLVPFDRDKAVAMAKEVNPHLELFYTSATTGDGLDTWSAFLRELVKRTKAE
jgi:hydrogenase nickel incorporation protein HypB